MRLARIVERETNAFSSWVKDFDERDSQRRRIAYLVFAILHAVIALAAAVLAVARRRRKDSPILLFFAGSFYSIGYGMACLATTHPGNVALFVLRNVGTTMAAIFLPLAIWASLDYRPMWFFPLPVLSFFFDMALVVIGCVKPEAIYPSYGIALTSDSITAAYAIALLVIAIRQPKPLNKCAKWIRNFVAPILVIASLFVLGSRSWDFARVGHWAGERNVTPFSPRSSSYDWSGVAVIASLTLIGLLATDRDKPATQTKSQESVVEHRLTAE